MPLNVMILINDDPIERITISRLQKLKAKDRWYTYMVSIDGKEATYQHRYSDGAVVCLHRALDAFHARHG